jgi:uncharacterized membrane protein YfcA
VRLFLVENCYKKNPVYLAAFLHKMDWSDFGFWSWIIVIICAVMIGMGKTGLSGTGMIIVPIMAAVFGGKPSTGLVLPMLCIADLFGVLYYHRHADWKHIFKLLPWTFTGLLAALLMGTNISDAMFKALIGLSILVGLVIMIWQDYLRKSDEIPSSTWFSALFGFGAGFSTMIGNAAGPIMAIYLLSARLPKNAYIGTGAWFFLIVNYTKVPLQVIFWKNITLHTLTLNLLMIPAIAAGAFLGFKLVKIIPEKAYRIFILVSTALSALFMF